MCKYKWALTREKLSFGFPTKCDSNQSPQLQTFWNMNRSKFRYDTFQKVNTKGADQSAGMHRLDCTFAVCKPQRQALSRQGLYNNHEKEELRLKYSTIDSIKTEMQIYGTSSVSASDSSHSTVCDLASKIA